MRITPLEAWAKEKTGGLPLEAWQLQRLRQTLDLARTSQFYRERLPGEPIGSLQDMKAWPLMDANDLCREGGAGLLCVPMSQVERVVTLMTTGTTGARKRVYFTRDDLMLTEGFFTHGLTTITEPGGVVAIFMPCNTPYGVGDMIARGLAHIPARAIKWGPLTAFAQAAAMLANEKVDSLIGAPVPMLALARYLRNNGIRTPLKKLLLSADNVPSVLINELTDMGLQVYKHFGMTETGYGCAIDCDAHAGQHIREPDLLLEIVDPSTGEPLPDGTWGEIVVTTLTRTGMPLIRYRTGDLSRIIPGVCPCGSSLRRLDDVRGRIGEEMSWAGGFSMCDLDEKLLAFPQVMDFSLAVGQARCRLMVHTFESQKPLTKQEVATALSTLAVPGLVDIEIKECGEYTPLHVAKRKLVYA